MKGGVKIFLLFIILFSSVNLYSQNSAGDIAIISAAKKVISQFVKEKSAKIKLEIIKNEPGNDTYEIEAKNGILTLRGNSAIALTRGFYDYLRCECRSMITWSGAHLDLPAQWPDTPKRKVTTPFQYRYYFNVVTFGYSTPFWNWARWKKEIDWMALHGINMPLALTATEAIGRKVWRKLGFTDKEINEFYSGAAFLPWQRMGNLTKHDGPLPDSWYKDQTILQHKILKYMRELGMEPIVPAFAGFVPKEFTRLNPDQKLNELNWGGFTKEFHAFVLSPESPYFEKIGKLFIQEWEKEFGKAKFYLADSFNEMDVPVPKDNPSKRYEILAGYGESVYNSIHAGNPDAVWVMQGWMFGYQADFWDKKSISALLSKVPNNKMLILDLACDYPALFWHTKQVWETNEGFYGKNWIYSVIPNMGGKTAYNGVLDFYAGGSFNALNSPVKGNLSGFGIAMEGIENNEVIYELLTDIPWSKEKIDLSEWIKNYCISRYGAYPKQMEKAWELFRATCYGTFTDHPTFIWQREPGKSKKGSVNTDPRFLTAVEYFLECSDELKKSPLYVNDAIELTALYLGIKTEELFKSAIDAPNFKGEDLKSALGMKGIELLYIIDRLLESHPLLKLKNWTGFAIEHGITKNEKNYYEADAKRILTRWGGEINDYSARMWSGLIRDYYIPRWKAYFAKGNDFNLVPQEERWINTPGISKIKAYADPLNKAKEIIEELKKENK